MREPLPGAEHGGVTMELAARLAAHARQHQLGRVFAEETGFLLSTGSSIRHRAPVTVYPGLDNIRVLRAEDELGGSGVVPGFSVTVGDLFS